MDSHRPRCNSHPPPRPVCCGDSKLVPVIKHRSQILNWMQDKESAVYVIATANNAESLPPELKRKGRFDEIFCVNLPDKKERAKIFEVHLRKKIKIVKNLRFSDNDYLLLAKVSNGFNGADIESVVNDTFEICYLNGKNSVTITELKEVVKETVSISKSCKQQIESMRKVFRESSFKDATTGKISNTST